MSTLSSRDRKTRNGLYLVEEAVVNRYRNMVVRELIEYMSTEEKQYIKLMPEDDLVSLHHSLGTAIRNEYELWMPEHEVTSIWHKCELSHPLAEELPNMPTEVLVGNRIIHVDASSAHMDDHPCHPDNFSMSCVRQLWETLQ